MEIDSNDGELNNNINRSENGSSKLIDSINNNINSLFEKFSRSASKIDTDESSLPSPKAMLETIMPCEKLCSGFQQIADDLVDSEAIKTHIKHEISEPKLASDGEDFGRDQFPLNLKAFKHAHEKKAGLNVSTSFPYVSSACLPPNQLALQLISHFSVVFSSTHPTHLTSPPVHPFDPSQAFTGLAEMNKKVNSDASYDAI